MKLKKYTTALLPVFLLISGICFGGHPELSADKILLRSGELRTTRDFSPSIATTLRPEEIYYGRYYRLMQFEKMPDENIKANLRSLGVRLLNYIPYNTYVVSLPASLDLSALPAASVRTLIPLQSGMKLSKELALGTYPAHALNVPGFIDLMIQFHTDQGFEDVLNSLQASGFNVIDFSSAMLQAHVRVQLGRIDDLAKLPFVKYLQAVSPAPEPEDMRGRSLHRSNVINSDYPGARHFNGEGVTISLADDGLVGPHIDFTGRLTQFSSSAGGSHGDMTSGIAVGAGNRNPLIRGMADGAQLLVHDISGYTHITNALSFYANYGAVITSTSYSQGCNDYDLFSSNGDQLVYQNPQFSLVFSAGNRGQNDCGYGAGAPYGTITGGYKQGKNVIACGNLDAYEVLDPTSSQGPAADGRVKPDICSNGKNQLSTSANNNYQTGGGTSAACPGVAGITAQLYQAYKEMNSGTEPESPLIKACMLNSAEDLGRPGPDFTYGWGRVNAFRALTTMEDHRYVLDSVAQGASRSHIIPVASGVKQLRVMLYWLDSEGDPLGSIALVNDLDLQVTDPNTISFLPWILDPSPNLSALTTNAVRGIDRLNNMEQVTIDDPAAGSYIVNVSGASVPAGTQRYYIVWEYRYDEIMLTYPNGGEGFVPGETEMLRWDAFGTSADFNLEYSVDNGISWSPIISGIAPNVRQYEWNIPQEFSDQVKLRISRGTATDTNDNLFTIAPLVTNIVVDFSCSDSLQISWNPVQGVGRYEVSSLGAMYMDSIASPTVNYARLGIPSIVSTWFSVRCVGPNGGKGRRAYAVQKNAGIVNCTLTDDMTMVSILNPAPGNLFDCQNLSAVPIRASLRNNGLADASNFNISYSINGGTPVVESYNGTLTHGSYLQYTFATTADLSLPGTYQIFVQVSYPGDQNASNDAQFINVFTNTIAQVPFTQDFQTATFPPVGWSQTNSGTTYIWDDKSGIIGSDGLVTTAAWFDNFSYNNPGALDYLTAVLTGLQGVTAPILTFDVAYAVYTGFEDGLMVEISTDCGQTFMPTGYAKFGAALASVPSSNTDWEPTLQSHWRRDTVDLSAYANSNVMVRFVNVNDYGNNLYVDNVNIVQNGTVGISPAEQPLLIRIVPNPSSGLFRLDLSNLPSGAAVVTVFDIRGKEIWNKELRHPDNKTQAEVDLSAEAAGLYFLKIQTNAGVYTGRLIRN